MKIECDATETNPFTREDAVNLAIIKFKELHWKPVKCSRCPKIDGVKFVEVWNDEYCEDCLNEALRDDEDDLFDSISEPDTEY